VMADTFNRIKTAVTNRFTETRDAVMNTAKNWVERMFKAGQDLIQGLIDGIGAMKDKLVRAIQWIIDKAIETVLDALGIRSPSRVFFDIGQNTMQGMINGIEDQRSNLMSLMDDVVNDMITRFAGVDVTPGVQFGRVDNPYGIPGNVGIINPNTGIIEIFPINPLNPIPQHDYYPRPSPVGPYIPPTPPPAPPEDPIFNEGNKRGNTYNITVNNPVPDRATDSIRREMFYLSAGVLA